MPPSNLVKFVLKLHPAAGLLVLWPVCALFSSNSLCWNDFACVLGCTLFSSGMHHGWVMGNNESGS